MSSPLIVLLVRSYNRPNYLKETLKSLIQSDIHTCSKRIIFDDCSDDPQVYEILHDPLLVNVPGKEFEIMYPTKNLGCKRSYLEAITRLPNCDYICTVDNDVHVADSFINLLLTTYEDAFDVYKTRNMLVTGFNPTNAHQTCIKQHTTFYTKHVCGGINYFFHYDFKKYILEQWANNNDWGVSNNMFSKKYPLVCLNTGVIQHIGQIGLHSGSGKKGYDYDANFKFTPQKTHPCPLNE